MGKKSSTPAAPAPDPAIGQAAAANAQLGQDWLNFAKQQYAAGELRQDDYDALTANVVNNALATQNTANQWAGEDRQRYNDWAAADRAIQADYRTKYDTWANEDRTLGRDMLRDSLQLGAEQRQLGKDYEQLYADIARRSSDAADRYEGQFGAAAKQQLGFGAEELDRYRTQFRPVQDKLVNDAMTWDSEERLASEAGKARADVLNGADMAKQAQQRSMASMGINPNSGRFAAADRGLARDTALAAAGAQNTARDTIRGQAIDMRNNAAQMGFQVANTGQQANQMGLGATSAAQGARQSGDALAGQMAGAGANARTSGISADLAARNFGLAATGVGNTNASLGSGQQGAGYSAQGAGYTGLGLGLNSGSAATGAQTAANSNFYQNGNVMAQGFGGAMSGYNNQANTLSNLYGNQLSAWGAGNQAAAQSSAGTGSMIGTIVGAGISAY